MPIAFAWLPSASEIMERHCEYFPYSVVGVFKLCPLTNDHLFSVLLGQQTFTQLCHSEYVSKVEASEHIMFVLFDTFLYVH